MPIMLELVHNKLTPASYEVMKDDFDFQQKQIRVCMMCYFELGTQHHDRSWHPGAIARGQGA
jgi:hypothetical protein